MSKVLIIRLSAIGDVAMIIPVVYSVAEDNPQDTFTVLTQSVVKPLFINPPSNVTVIGVNSETTAKTFSGFFSFAWKLRSHHFDLVIDLHDVIRSWMVDYIFWLSGKPVFVINKRRKESKRLTARPPKVIYKLQPVIDRYADVFKDAGFKFDIRFTSLFEKKPVDEAVIKAMNCEKTGRWIGIAPFARHNGKVYPIEKMEKVIACLSAWERVTVFLFGGRGEEWTILNRWEHTYKNTINTVGRFSIDMELSLMNRLDVLVSMDSANMHLASLVGTKVVSIWGATHPFAGFYGYRQQEAFIVHQELPCRPCSVYGSKPCYRNDYACLMQIEPEKIIAKIEEAIQ